MNTRNGARTWPDEELYIPHRPTDGMMQARKERRRLMIGAGLVVALVAICWLSPARATPWTAGSALRAALSTSAKAPA